MMTSDEVLDSPNLTWSEGFVSKVLIQHGFSLGDCDVQALYHTSQGRHYSAPAILRWLGY